MDPRMRMGLPARPNDGPLPRRRIDPIATSGQPQRPTLQHAKTDYTSTRTAVSSSSIPRTTNMPQGTSRRPSGSQGQRPTLEHQPYTYGPETTMSQQSYTYERPASKSMKMRHVQGVTARNPSGTRQRDTEEAVVPTSRRLRKPSVSAQQPRPAEHALGIRHGRPSLEETVERSSGDSKEPNRSHAQPTVYPELDRYRDHRKPFNTAAGQDLGIEVPFRLATENISPLTPSSGLHSASSSQISAISSPSTKWSESPGPGSFSRDTTPTSMSSPSPSLMMPAKASIKPRPSPAGTRPPVSRRRAGSLSNECEVPGLDRQGLPAVRESLNSSSSSSTVRDEKRSDRKQKSHLPAPPQNPPPRKSSQKFKKNSTDAVPGSSRPSTAPGSPPKKPLDNQAASPPTSTRPQRPSRENTPDIRSQLLAPAPIVKSNLSTSSLPTERRGSDASAPSALPRTPLSPPSRRQAPSSQTSLHKPSASDKTQASTQTDADERKGKTRTPSPNVSSLGSRFPFFSRRKPSADPAETEKKREKKKIVRKGPAAGTGHEGYGRLGARRRQSGSTSDGTRDFSSQESLVEDDFLTRRTSPVVIAGGEVVDNRNASSEIARSENGRPSVDSCSKVNSARTGISSSPGPLKHAVKPQIRRPSDSSGSDAPMKPTLAYRRSKHRLSSSPTAPVRMPQPIVTRGVTAPSPLTSFDTTISDDSHYEKARETARLRDNAHPPPKKLTKRNRSPRRWNIFSRSKSQHPAKSESEEEVTAAMMQVQPKPMAFYTMMDSSDQEECDITEDIQQILRSADVYMSATSLPMSSATSLDKLHHTPPVVNPPPSPSKDRPSLDSASAAHPIEPSNCTQHTGEAHYEPSVKHSRLPQVGRIPKVVSNRSGRRLSFSQPFNPGREPTKQAEHARMSPLNQVTPGLTVSPRISEPAFDGSNSSSQVAPGAREFLAISPPRKNSDGTVGTSSSSSISYKFLAATAIVPHPDDPAAEDEVWDEYDELLGDSQVPVSATSSKGNPFALETRDSKLLRKISREKPMASPTIVPDSRQLSTVSKGSRHSSSHSADMTERIRTAFQPHNSPPVSFSGKPESARRRNSVDSCVSIPKRMQSTSTIQERGAGDTRDSTVSSSSSDDGSPLAQVNLRVGSMTVSKWLSFGHVLFSDVRHELMPVDGSLKRQSILVLDGLGNDDWSFYAAETYPAASFFNLSPRAPLSAELRSSPSGFPLSPPNHHQIQYSSHLDKFPFAPQSFTSLVYRFPVAASEATYRNILSEARRVLKPDGYLELSILDVDLNNMGHLGRKAVRGLKERIHNQAPDTSLASTADLIVRLLGAMGFSGIKAARVGVPVACPTSKPKKPTDTADATGANKAKSKPSLAEMMSTSGVVADEGITKMVSKVGRWWHSRCYESVAGPAAEDLSMWNDKAFLRECEELGTSLKLMSALVLLARAASLADALPPVPLAATEFFSNAVARRLFADNPMTPPATRSPRGRAIVANLDDDRDDANVAGPRTHPAAAVNNTQGNAAAPAALVEELSSDPPTVDELDDGNPIETSAAEPNDPMAVDTGAVPASLLGANRVLRGMDSLAGEMTRGRKRRASCGRHRRD